jgi:hypothetical protein
MCGTQVTVDGIPAGLLAVLERQINLKIPQEVPAAADAAVVVTVNGVSSQPVMVAFGKPKVILSVEGAAYVHMPVWIALKRPLPYNVAYPYALNPGNFGGGRFEVMHNGIVLKPLEIQDPPGGMAIGGILNGSIAPAGSPPGRLPLHLQYRFDTPGRYEVRFIGTRLDVGSVGSKWMNRTGPKSKYCRIRTRNAETGLRSRSQRCHRRPDCLSVTQYRDCCRYPTNWPCAPYSRNSTIPMNLSADTWLPA